MGDARDRVTGPRWVLMDLKTSAEQLCQNAERVTIATATSEGQARELLDIVRQRKPWVTLWRVGEGDAGAVSPSLVSDDPFQDRLTEMLSPVDVPQESAAFATEEEAETPASDDDPDEVPADGQVVSTEAEAPSDPGVPEAADAAISDGEGGEEQLADTSPELERPHALTASSRPTQPVMGAARPPVPVWKKPLVLLTALLVLLVGVFLALWISIAFSDQTPEQVRLCIEANLQHYRLCRPECSSHTGQDFDSCVKRCAKEKFGHHIQNCGK